MPQKAQNLKEFYCLWYTAISNLLELRLTSKCRKHLIFILLRSPQGREPQKAEVSEDSGKHPRTMIHKSVLRLGSLLPSQLIPFFGKHRRDFLIALWWLRMFHNRPSAFRYDHKLGTLLCGGHLTSNWLFELFFICFLLTIPNSHIKHQYWKTLGQCASQREQHGKVCDSSVEAMDSQPTDLSA